MAAICPLNPCPALPCVGCLSKTSALPGIGCPSRTCPFAFVCFGDQLASPPAVAFPPALASLLESVPAIMHHAVAYFVPHDAYDVKFPKSG